MPAAVMPQFQTASRARPARTRRSASFDPANAEQQTAQVASGLQGQTDAYATGARMDFSKDVGNLLGNLNAIGGIRSGAVKTGANDLARTYGGEMGRQVAQTAVSAAQIGTQRAGDIRGDVTQRYGIDTGAATSRYSTDVQASTEAAGLAERAKEFGSDLEFRRTSAASEESRFARDLAERGASRTQQGTQFESELGFRRESETRRAGESQRDFEQRKAEAAAGLAEQQASRGQQGSQFNTQQEADRAKQAEDRRRYEYEKRKAQEKLERSHRGFGSWF